jgi:hypothetical protein
MLEMFDVNFVLGKTGGKTRVCYSTVACEDCRMSNVECE